MTRTRAMTAILAGITSVVLLAACKDTPGATGSDATVTGTESERDGSTTTLHYADCAVPGGGRYRVQVPAEVEYQLQRGINQGLRQPCPDGPQLPLAQDQYPQLYHELQKRLPYGGGDAYDPRCGEWQTIDKQEARRMAKTCPPLKWGDLN